MSISSQLEPVMLVVVSVSKTVGSRSLHESSDGSGTDTDRYRFTKADSREGWVV